jgi:hypothetical protein
MRFWEQLAAWLTLVAIPTAAVNYWLGEGKKAAIREKITIAWINVVATDALTFTKMPFRLLSKAVDRIYGKKLFSWKSFWRVSVFGTCMLLASLALFGISTRKPLFGIETPPWESFNVTFQAIEQSAQNEQLWKDEKPEDRESRIRLIEKLRAYNTSTYKVGYSLAFFALVLGLNCLMYFFCFGIARKVLRATHEASSFVTFFSLLTLNVLVSTIAYTLCLSIVCVAAAPILWTIAGLLLLVFFASKLTGILLMFPAILCVLWLSPGWIRLFAVNAALPSILLIGVSLVALLVFPVRTHVQRMLGGLLHKLASRDYAVIAIVILGLSGIVAWLTHVL